MSYGVSVPKSLAQTWGTPPVSVGAYFMENVRAKFDGIIKSAEVYADSDGMVYFYVILALFIHFNII